MNSMEDFIVELMGEEAAERFFNPIRSEYQKRLEEKGWEFVGNSTFFSMMDQLESLEQIWGEPLFLKKQNLRERAAWKRNWYRKIYPDAEKVRFFRAHDIYGERIPKEELYAGVYIKRRVN